MLAFWRVGGLSGEVYSVEVAVRLKENGLNNEAGAGPAEGVQSREGEGLEIKMREGREGGGKVGSVRQYVC